MNKFTKEEIMFLNKYGLSSHDFYDARGENKFEYHEHAKKNGCLYVIGNYCHKGHRLKTRSGNCIVCDPRTITFQKRHRASGVIYVAENGSYSKVGVVDNNIGCAEQAIHNREIRLNLEGGYGGMTGWKIIAWAEVANNVGMIENSIHRKLMDYSISTHYIHSGECHLAHEMFDCASDEVINTINLMYAPDWIMT